MATKRLAILQGGKTTPIESEQEELDFASVRVGASKLKISEADSSTFDFNGKKAKVADGTAADHASSKGQLDTVESGLQTQITANQSNANSRVSKSGDTMTGDLTMSGGAKIVGLPLVPSTDTEAVPKAYADALFQGVRPKDAVRFLVDTNVVGTFVDGVLTTALTSLTSDDVTAADGDRVLLVGQTAGLENGIYDVAGVGVAIELTRSDDANDDAKVRPGMSVWVSEGTVNGDQGWALTTNDPISLNGTPLSFTQISGLGQVVAGAGLTKTGNQIDVAAGDGVKIVSDQVASDYAATLVNDNASPITVGQIVYLKTNGAVDLASAAEASYDTLLGIVEAASIASAASGKIVVRRGAVVGGFSGLTPGKRVYPHNTTAGSYTQDPTTIAASKYLHSVGRAISATQIVYDPQYETRIGVYDFDVGVGGQTDFTVTEGLVANQKIEVMVNGREARLGGGHDYTVNTGLNKVVFNYTVPQNAWVRVRVYK